MKDSKRIERIRYPLTLFVEKIEFEPKPDVDGVTRTVYDLDIDEFYMRQLHKFLDERLKQVVISPARIRVTGILRS